MTGASANPPANPRATALDILDHDSIVDNPDFTALDARDRRLARRLIANALRHHGEAKAMLTTFMERLPTGKNRKAGLAMIMAAAELGFGGDSGGGAVAPHAVLNETVGIIKSSPSRHLAGLANAVLRRVAENITSFKPDPVLNLPPWLADALTRDYGDDTTARIAASLMTEPALDLTIKNPDHTNDWATRLNGTPIAANAIRLATGDGYIPDLNGYKQGAWWVQDIAASIPVRLLGDIKNKTVADCAAAPGGKTAQICAHGAITTAIDISKNRLKRLRENMTRLDLTPEIITADITDENFIQNHAQSFDAVLVDAPCSATGTIRRRPDILTHETPPDFTALTKLQSDMLRAASRLTRPGGVLVFATCSLLKCEGEDIINNLPATLAPYPITPDELPAGFAHIPDGASHALHLMPDSLDKTGHIQQGNDGFFIARFTSTDAA